MALTNNELTALVLELQDAVSNASGGSGSGSSEPGEVNLTDAQTNALNGLADALSDILALTQNPNTKLGQACASDTKTLSTCCWIILKGLAACVESLDQENANIKNLTAGNIKTNIINAVTGSFETAIVNDLDAQDIEAETVNVKQMLARVARLLYTITDSVDAASATIYKINTSDVEIVGDNNKMSLDDGVLVIKDGNNITRVQVGKQANGDYNLCLWDASGNALWNAQGLCSNAIANSLITDSKIASGVNYEKIKVTDTKTLKNVLDLLVTDEEIEESDDGTATMWSKVAQISTSVNGLSSTVSNHTTQFDTMGNRVTSVENNVTTLQQTSTGLQTSVSTLQGSMSTLQQTATGLQTQITNNDVTSSVHITSGGVEIYKSNSPVKLTVDSTGIKFVNTSTNNELGFWDGTLLHTGNMYCEVNKYFRMGDFSWIPGSDGSLCLTYVGGN